MPLYSSQKYLHFGMLHLSYVLNSPSDSNDYECFDISICLPCQHKNELCLVRDTILFQKHQFARFFFRIMDNLERLCRLCSSPGQFSGLDGYGYPLNFLPFVAEHYRTTVSMMFHFLRGFFGQQSQILDIQIDCI